MTSSAAGSACCGSRRWRGPCGSDRGSDLDRGFRWRGAGSWCAPAGSLNGLRLANPAQLFLDAPSDSGEQVGCLKFGQGGGLRFGETSVRAFQDGPAERLGELAVPGFRAADLVERLGEELHDVEPIHGDGGIVEALANGRDERTAHVADHLDDATG